MCSLSHNATCNTNNSTIHSTQNQQQIHVYLKWRNSLFSPPKYVCSIYFCFAVCTRSLSHLFLVLAATHFSVNIQIHAARLTTIYSSARRQNAFIHTLTRNTKNTHFLWNTPLVLDSTTRLFCSAPRRFRLVWLWLRSSCLDLNVE